MKDWQYYGIQGNLMVVACMTATTAISKGVLLFLALLYCLMMILAIRE